MPSSLPNTNLPSTSKTNDNQLIGIDGFWSYVTISETTSLTSQAPDFVCEDLSVVQETIYNTPRTFEITGSVADIYRDTTPVENFFTPISKTFGVVKGYLPDRTLSQIQKVQGIADDISNTIGQVAEVINDVRKVFDIFGDKTEEKSNQQVFYDKIRDLHLSRRLIAVEIGREELKNMHISNFSFTETNDGDMGEFSMSLKEIRIASVDTFRNTVLTPAQEAKGDVDSEIAKQTDAITVKGITKGVAVDSNKANALIGGLA